MLAEARAHFPFETGGVLLGHERGRRLVVSHQVGAGPKALHERTSFTPDRDWQYAQIDLIYAHMNGNLAYLGDWHTHPGGAPKPSTTDRVPLHRTAINPACQCPSPIMLILGDPDRDGHWAAAAHRLIRSARGGRLKTTRLVLAPPRGKPTATNALKDPEE